MTTTKLADALIASSRGILSTVKKPSRDTLTVTLSAVVPHVMSQKAYQEMIAKNEGAKP